MSVDQEIDPKKGALNIILLSIITQGNKCMYKPVFVSPPVLY